MTAIISQIRDAIPADQRAFLYCQLLCILFAELYYRLIRPLQSTNAKHTYTFVVSNVLLMTLLGGCPWRVMLHIYAPVVVTHVWVSKLQWGPWPLTVGLFAHLAWAHWAKMRERYLNYNLDQTVVLMLMVIKLTSFAFDMHDQKSAGNDDNDKNKNKNMVGMVEFLGYSFLFPGFVSGPAILFPQYRQFISNTIVDRHHQKRHRVAMRQFAMALVFGAAHVALKPVFNHDTLLTDWYRQAPLMTKLVYLHIANMASRFMYYTAWLMAESSLLVMGFPLDSVQIVRPLHIESASTPRQILQNWNIATDRWLHRYYYLRMSAHPTFANVVVKMVSAVWHGFYPGYYCMFASFGVVTACTRLMYRRVRCPVAEGWRRRLLLWLPNWLLVDYLTPPFVLLTWQKSVAFYRQSHWWGHVVCIFIIIVLSLKPKEK